VKSAIPPITYFQNFIKLSFLNSGKITKFLYAADPSMAMLLDLMKKGAVYTLLGLGILVAPATLSNSTTSVYAQEQKEEPKKEQTLEDKISDAIQRLETLEKKTPKDYVRLVDLYYNFSFDKEKIITTINEAVCSLEKEQSEYKYLETIRLFLSEKKEDAFKLAETFLKDLTAPPRLKANLSMTLYPGSPEKALDLDSSHMPAIIGLFKDTYKKEIAKFEGVGYAAQYSEFPEEWTKQLQETLAKKYKPKYNAAVSSNVEQPEKLFYLSELHRSYAEFLKQAHQRIKDRHYKPKWKSIDLSRFAQSVVGNLMKEIKECYLKAITANTSYYETYIDLGDHITNMFYKDSDKKNLESYEYYQKAYALIKNAYDHPKTKDIEKNKLKLKLGKVCYNKGKCLELLMWGFTDVSRNVSREYFHEDQAEEALKEYTEALRHYESIEEKDRTSEEMTSISLIRGGISSVKYRQSEWAKKHPKKK